MVPAVALHRLTYEMNKPLMVNIRSGRRSGMVKPLTPVKHLIAFAVRQEVLSFVEGRIHIWHIRI